MSAIASMNRIDLLIYFKENILKFFDALIELLPKEGDLIMIRVMLTSQIPIENALKIFASRIVPNGEMVKAKDERFFLECTDLFAGIRKDRVSYFKDLWASGTLTPQDKEQLWKWFKLFLLIALRFQTLENGY